MKVRKSLFFPMLRILGLMVVGLGVAIVVTLSQINLESLRGNVLAILRDSTGLPIEIDGTVSWKFSLRPYVELNQVRVASESWAKNKDAFTAEKIDVRLNLLSLFRDRPTIQNVKVYNAKINLEKNAAGKYSVASLAKKIEDVKNNEEVLPEKYPFKDAGLGGVEVKNLTANILGNHYELAGFNIRLMPNKPGREYSGWLKADNDLFPFIVRLSEYNAERKIYPVQVALSTGGDALIANVALEGTSKVPIDFVVRGDIPNPGAIGKIVGMDLEYVPSLRLNIAGGYDREKIVLRKSSVVVNETEFTISGDWDWSTRAGAINLNLYSPNVALIDLFPGLYAGGAKKSGKELNVFKDTPLFAKYLRGRTAKVRVNFGKFVMYRDLNLSDMKLDVDLRNNVARVDINTSMADGNIRIAIDADIDNDGRVWLQSGAVGKHIVVGKILKEVDKKDFLSDLPMNFEFYVRANGENLSQIMQTITGPVQLYSDGPGYAHSAMVSYMYGTDFLTSLRHSVQDLFSSEKKYNQIKISCVAVNVKLRDGVIETQNGVAIETNAINIRLAGMLNLGDEEMKLALTTVPVRGIKLSLMGNVVNSIELTGSLAEPDIRISGAAMAGKVASATGLGLLLAPFTGGVGLVAGTGIGLVAGDLLENWLADGKPCETAMDRGAPLYRDDPEWMGETTEYLIKNVLETE